MKIELYDTTLRDGAQKIGISFSLKDKLKIAQKLDEFGFDYIEGGWPASNPKDSEFFNKIKSLNLNHSKVVAFGMTKRKEIRASDDFNLKELLKAETEIVTIFGKTWDLHVRDVLKTSLKENLSIIKESCRFLTSHNKRVFYDAEHFFDGFKANSKYALLTLEAAVAGGAERIILCDTNGGSLPWEIRKIVNEVKKKIKVPLGIHTHNDSGLSVANSLEAIKCGVSQIQGTINGYGERCGNLDFCVIIPTLQLKMGVKCLQNSQLSALTELSRFVYEIANLPPDSSQPYVGINAFSHKGGVHADAMTKNKKTYQHIDPSLVGNFSKIAVSELSGKANILTKISDFSLNSSKIPEKLPIVLDKIKKLESKGFQFENADASLELLIRRILGNYHPPFKILDLNVSINKKKNYFASRAKIKLQIKNKIVETNEDGKGPVNALDRAIRRALLPFYPKLKNIRLTNYSVRILDSKEGTAAWVRVLIDTTDSYGRTWTTIGSSFNIIEASFKALIDSIEYAILKQG